MTVAVSRRPGARGFALFTSLMFLVVLTALAAVVLKTSTNNERIAGGDLDRALAYQLAEATIRDAQQDILNIRSNNVPCTDAPPSCRPATDTPNKDTGLGYVSYMGVCSRGRCYLGRDSEPPLFPGDPGTLYDNPDFVAPWIRPRLAIGDPAREHAVYGELTDPTFTADDENWSRIQDNTGVTERPVYWIEVFAFGPASERFLYRITVEATGRNPTSVVRLQEIYEPAL